MSLQLESIKRLGIKAKRVSPAKILYRETRLHAKRGQDSKKVNRKLLKLTERNKS